MTKSCETVRKSSKGDNMSIEEQGLSRRQFMAVSAGTAAALLGGLAACKKEEPKPDPDPTPSPEPTPEPEATTQVIVDNRGDSVEVPLKVEKICDLWHAHNQITLMLGAGDKLVGTTQNFKNRKWANKVYPRLSEVTALVVGSGAGEVNYEEMLKLEPDLCFVSADAVAEGCRQYGLATLNVGFQDYEKLRRNVEISAQAIGGDAVQRGKDWEAYLNKNIDLVEERMKGIAEADRPRILHIVSPSSLTKVDAKNCIVDEWIKLAGGQNALEMEGNMIEVAMEEIVKADPEVIIIGSGGADAVKTLMENEAWSGIKAVKEGRVYANPNGVFAWDRYSGEEALQVIWAAKFFNPDKFTDIDMVQEVKDFYKKFYGATMTTAQCERILAGEDPED